MALPSSRLSQLVETAGAHADEIQDVAPGVAGQAAKAAPATRKEESFDVWNHTVAGAEGASSERPADTWKAAADSPSREWAHTDSEAVGASLQGQADEALKKFQLLTGQRKAEPGEEDPQGFLGGLGATFDLLTSLEQMISAPLAMLPFPAFPALRVMDMDIGLPHGHTHPPNLVPPAPMVFLPSTGPIIPIPFLSGATRTLINGMPAGRCGDMGLGVWCGGYFPMYEVFLGSSSVWIEGARAGRLLVDVTRHCIFSAPKPSDPPLGPMVGMTITASPNVLVGGVPMPSLLDLAMGAVLEALFKGIGKAVKRAKELRAQRLADDVRVNRASLDDFWTWLNAPRRPRDTEMWGELMDAKFIEEVDELERAKAAFRAESDATAYVKKLIDEGSIGIDNMSDEMADLVRKDLIHIAANPVGRSTLERIRRSGHKTEIRAGRMKRAQAKAKSASGYFHDGYGRHGSGCGTDVQYDPTVTLAPGATPDSILHHELAHAANNAEGVNQSVSFQNTVPVKPLNSTWELKAWLKGQRTMPGPSQAVPEPGYLRPGTTEAERLAEANNRWTNLEEQNVIRNQCNPYREQYGHAPRWGHANLSTVPGG